jgi:hypothetical protein
MVDRIHQSPVTAANAACASENTRIAAHGLPPFSAAIQAGIQSKPAISLHSLISV